MRHRPHRHRRWERHGKWNGPGNWRSGQEKVRTLEEERKEFQKHFVIFLVMSVFFFAVDMLSGPGHFWFYWPVLGWGIGVVFHYLKAYVPAFYEEGQEKEEEELELKEFDKIPEKEPELRGDQKKWSEGDLV